MTMKEPDLSPSRLTNNSILKDKIEKKKKTLVKQG
jgi:hypothetical protein